MRVTFRIPGQPVAKGRARAFVRNGHVGHYTPEKTARYENLVKLAAAEAMDGKPAVDGRVSLTVDAVFAIPQSWSLKKQRAAALREISPTGRPDIDNVVKAIKDGCNTVVWRDDSQVTELAASKIYGDPGVTVSAQWEVV